MGHWNVFCAITHMSISGGDILGKAIASELEKRKEWEDEDES